MALPDAFDTLDACISYWAEHTPQNEAAVNGALRLSYGELEATVAQCATLLRHHDISVGDIVAVMANPGLTYLVLLMAISRVGGIYVGVNPRYVVDEIQHIVDMTTPSLLFVETNGNDPERITRAEQTMKDTQVIAIQSLSDLKAGTNSVNQSPSAPNDVAVIVFTSGSTGQPKGAALHHGGLLAAAIGQSKHIDGEPRRYLSNLPVNHVGGVMNLTLGCLVAGGTLIFQPKFDAGETLQLIEREKISSWLQVPTMFAMVTRHADFASSDLSSIRSICIGGGAIAVPTLEKLRTTGAKIFVEYGQTEVMSTLTFSDEGADDDVLLGTIGKFSPLFETRVANEDNSLCPIGSVGEIQARGDCVLRKYWNAPEATKAAFTADGWLKTGDLALVRDDQNVVLKGRATEMIKSGGYNVYPREVEQVLEAHPAIAEVVVFGIQDDLYGEIVSAAVEFRASCQTSFDIEELRSYCRGKLAGYKIPRRVIASKMLPRLPNGKLDRKKISGPTFYCNG